jgi:hypothetical protein
MGEIRLKICANAIREVLKLDGAALSILLQLKQIGVDVCTW